MLRNLLAAALLVPLAFAANAADAKGCIKGAAVGGVAGHVAGHHAVAGAAIGCAIGHHEASKKAKEDKARANAQAIQSNAATKSNASQPSTSSRPTERGQTDRSS